MDKDDDIANLGDVLSTDDKLKEFVYSDIYHCKTDEDGNFIYDGKNQIPKDATKIIITDSVKYIRDNEFLRFYELESIVIPNFVISIGQSAFAQCESLQTVTIPDSVTEIGNRAFAYCYSLQSIRIPDSVISIGEYAFRYCRTLTSINIPNSVKSMGFEAFSYCESLQSITIPDSLIAIAECSFMGCKSLQSITIPDSVISIGNYAFYGCDNLEEVILENPYTIYEDNTFPEHTKVIKKGVNENMKIKTNESISLRRAKRLLENNGYLVRKKKYLKESDDNTWSDILQSISKTIDNIDNVTMTAQSNVNDILHGKHTAIPNIVLTDSETSFLLDIYDKLLLLQDEISQIGDYVWKR